MAAAAIAVWLRLEELSPFELSALVQLTAVQCNKGKQ
jgi:hypothetical protein